MLRSGFSRARNSSCTLVATAFFFLKKLKGLLDYDNDMEPGMCTEVTGIAEWLPGMQLIYVKSDSPGDTSILPPIPNGDSISNITEKKASDFFSPSKLRSIPEETVCPP